MGFTVKKGTVPPEPLSKAQVKYPWSSLQVGEMFFVPGKKTANFSTYASKKGRDYGFKFSTQTATMRPDLQTGEWEVCKPNEPGAKQGVLVRRIS